ncbi:MAG: hypothetical protein ABFD18_19815 [Syntrophomonas sp.]
MNNKLSSAVISIIVIVILIGLCWNSPGRLGSTSFSEFFAGLNTPLEAIAKVGAVIGMMALVFWFQSTHKK